MGKLSFNIDKKQVTEHEHVTVSWDCENPDQVTLRAVIGGKAWFDFSKVKDWWSRTSAGLKTAWTYMPENKKLATKILGLMCAVMLVTGFAPKLFPLGLLAIMGYLTWIILKR